MPELGKIVGGKYRLVRQLGKGGMGVVYEAEHVRLGGRVAVKFIQQTIGESSTVVERFEREARAAVSVGHEGVIGIQDIGITEDAKHFIVMELLRGRSLGALLDEEDRLDIPFAAYIACQVLSALSAVHEAGIVHRDLKPENIFLVETGAPLPGVKILDFGISQIMSGEKRTRRLTETGVVLGTPEYMSPEQARGRHDIDRRGDIFALGVILYQCLTSYVPFAGDNYNAVLASILMDTPVQPQIYRSNIPEKLQAAVMRALTKDRNERFQDATEMFTELKAFVADHALFRIPPPQDPLTASVDAIIGDDTDQVDLPEAHDSTSHPFDDELDASPTVEMVLTHRSDPSQQGLDAGYADDGNALDLSDTEPIVRDKREEHTAGDRRTRRRALLIVAVVIILSSAVAVSIVGQLESNEPSEIALVEPAPPEDEIGVRRASSQRASLGEAQSQSTTIRITFEKLPEKAIVLVDGTAAASLPLKLRKGSSPHTIRIEQQGYEPFVKSVIPDRDRNIQVELIRRGRNEPTSSGPVKNERSAHRMRQRKAKQQRSTQVEQITTTAEDYEPNFFPEE